MVTETPAFAGAGLPPLSSLVFGGHDTAHCPLPKRAEHLTEAGVLPHGLASAVRAELAAADAGIRPGGPGAGDTRGDEELVTAFAADIEDFRARNALARVVVVGVSSTEPLPEPGAVRLPPSSLYAAAAVRAGCPYVNFTPSTGLRTDALTDAVAASGLPHAGRDGKTGQTLLRAVLAPMFVQRALDVRAWSGTNLLGGGDGAALADPAAAPERNASSPTPSGTHRRARSTSTTYPRSATGRPPGTTSPSRASSGRG
jgi:myo-inositol-1-phosphate synthase